MTNPLDTRDLLLEAALDLFAERGFRGTTTRAIADRAEVRLGLLAYHWGSKQELWAAALERLNRRLVEIATAAAYEQDRELPAAIAVFVGQVARELLADPRPLRVMAWASMELEVDREPVRRAYGPAIELATAFLQLHQARGAIPADVDVPLALITFYGLLAEPVLEPAVHAEVFGLDHTDPAHAARLERHLVRSALRLLGLPLPPQERP